MKGLAWRVRCAGWTWAKKVRFLAAIDSFTGMRWVLWASTERIFRGKCGQLLYVAVAPPISSLSILHISYKARCGGMSSRQKEIPNKQTRACGTVVDLTLYKILLESALFVTGKVIAKCHSRLHLLVRK
jgi:hypothetical protein